MSGAATRHSRIQRRRFRHDAESVQLCLVEGFTFRVVTPEAAVALTP
jgi:hypothetical protein